MISMNTKFAFFDSPKVIRSVDRMKRRELAQAGGFVRTTSRRSIRKRKRVSLPGQPPSSHSGELRQIRFGFDSKRDSVVVGPVKFKKGNIPQALEHGGITTVLRRNPNSGKIEKKRIRIKARPSMDPALQKAIPRFPGLFRDSLRG